MFRLKGVRYKHILNIEELIIPADRITCVTGESGSGKTTFLKLLNHMISPDTGEIFYQGKDITSYDPVSLRREVAMLPQEPSVFPGSIAENLNLGRIFTGRPPLDAHELQGMLEQVKLSLPLAGTAMDLSGGEKQRLALARLLTLEPQVLLLDEPSSALDEGTEESIIQLVVDFVRKKSRTLVMVTHSARIADARADYMVKITDGKLLYAREVRKRP